MQRVLVFPAWGDNPYLNLMSLAPRASGYEFRGATILESLINASAELGPHDVLHLHWTAPILQKASDDREAATAFGRFQALLDRLRDRQVKLVWTVHNQLPHELVYRDAEIRLYRLLAERADLIHVMAPATPDVLAEICTLPAARVRGIPHPSYLGVYGVPPAKSEARALLGVDPLAPTILFLGQMRPYKGLGTLLAALQRLAEGEGPLPTLLLAGAASSKVRAEIESALPKGISVVAKYEFVPDGEVGTWFAAADLAVFPYRAILNSGSLHLAAAFGVPAMVPNEPHLVDQFASQSWVSFFDVADPIDSMAQGIRERLLRDQPDESSHLGFDEFNDAVSPWRISLRYAALLDEVTGRRVS